MMGTFRDVGMDILPGIQQICPPVECETALITRCVLLCFAVA